MMNWAFAQMQKIRLQERDAFAQLDAGMNDLELGSDGGATVTNDTHDTTPADELASQPIAGQPARKAKTVVVSLKFAGASVITAKVGERNMGHPDVPTGLIADVDSEALPAEDPISSTKITLGCGRTGKNVTVSVEFSGDASDGDDGSEGLRNEKA